MEGHTVAEGTVDAVAAYGAVAITLLVEVFMTPKTAGSRSRAGSSARAAFTRWRSR